MALNSSITDYKYINMISQRLPAFVMKHSNPIQGNFRCVFCGDSKKNSHKKRGYILFDSDKQRYRYYCHNCERNFSFGEFLEIWDPTLYKSYIFDLFKDNNIKGKGKFSKNLNDVGSVNLDRNYMQGLSKVSSLPYAHPAALYVKARKIPPEKHFDIFYTDNYIKHVNKFVTDKISENKSDHRIVFPLRRRDGSIFGMTGRSLIKNSPLRYLITLFDDDGMKISGLEKVDPNNITYITEGTIDSFYLDNSIAFLGTNIDIEKAIKFGNLQDDKIVFVFDNEPRNHDVVEKMVKRVNQGFSIVIYPNNILHKDLNLIHRKQPEINIKDMVRHHTFKGLNALLKIASWRKDI